MMGTKKGQRRKTARRAYKQTRGYQITYQVGQRRRTLPTKFRTKTQARAVAKSLGGQGKNPRVKKAVW